MRALSGLQKDCHAFSSKLHTFRRINQISDGSVIRGHVNGEYHFVLFYLDGAILTSFGGEKFIWIYRANYKFAYKVKHVFVNASGLIFREMHLKFEKQLQGNCIGMEIM